MCISHFVTNILKRCIQGGNLMRLILFTVSSRFAVVWEYPWLIKQGAM